MGEDPAPSSSQSAATTVAALRPDTSGHNLVVKASDLQSMGV